MYQDLPPVKGHSVQTEGMAGRRPTGDCADPGEVGTAPASATTMEENVTLLAAFGAGLLSFISPCVLPLVPGYLSYVSGLSLDDLRGTNAAASAGLSAHAPASSWRRWPSSSASRWCSSRLAPRPAPLASS